MPDLPVEEAAATQLSNDGKAGPAEGTSFIAGSFEVVPVVLSSMLTPASAVTHPGTLLVREGLRQIDYLHSKRSICVRQAVGLFAETRHIRRAKPFAAPPGVYLKVTNIRSRDYYGREILNPEY